MTDLAELEIGQAPPFPPLPSGQSCRVLQLGMGWFAEQPGGLDRYFSELLKQLPAAGVTTRGLVCGSAGVQVQSSGMIRSAINTTASLPHRLLAFRQAINQELLDFRPDLVVGHFALYAWLALGVLRDCPFVAHFHGPWFAETRAEGASRWNTWAKYRIERNVYSRADRLITLSEAFKQVLIREFAVDESRISVVRGGVDCRKFNLSESREEARASLGWASNRPIVLSVRRLAKRMGLENLIHAAKAVRAKIPSVLFLIAGKGRLRQDLQDLIDAEDLSGHVQLLGFLPDTQLPLAYRAADLSVVPSIAWEGFGLVAAESLAAGTPTVVTSVGGLPEIVLPLRPSLVAPDSSIDSLAETIVTALCSSNGVPTAKECRNYARRFDWPSVASEICETVYRPAMRESNQI